MPSFFFFFYPFVSIDERVAGFSHDFDDTKDAPSSIGVAAGRATHFRTRKPGRIITILQRCFTQYLPRIG
jgi:hypothetical protein